LSRLDAPLGAFFMRSGPVVSKIDAVSTPFHLTMTVL